MGFMTLTSPRLTRYDRWSNNSHAWSVMRQNESKRGHWPKAPCYAWPHGLKALAWVAMDVGMASESLRKQSSGLTKQRAGCDVVCWCPRTVTVVDRCCCCFPQLVYSQSLPCCCCPPRLDHTHSPCCCFCCCWCCCCCSTCGRHAVTPVLLLLFSTASLLTVIPVLLFSLLSFPTIPHAVVVVVLQI